MRFRDIQRPPPGSPDFFLSYRRGKKDGRLDSRPTNLSSAQQLLRAMPTPSEDSFESDLAMIL